MRYYFVFFICGERTRYGRKFEDVLFNVTEYNRRILLRNFMTRTMRPKKGCKVSHERTRKKKKKNTQRAFPFVKTTENAAKIYCHHDASDTIVAVGPGQPSSSANNWSIGHGWNELLRSVKNEEKPNGRDKLIFLYSVTGNISDTVNYIFHTWQHWSKHAPEAFITSVQIETAERSNVLFVVRQIFDANLFKTEVYLFS